ncbi:unnamed protein product [Mycena citricolor]|uniref:TPR-like protein n=1 Tax=Mycena citricolor TaxID=2018698 RepID=A0AAD2HVP7_9AGAR|nr:unnamed protein product [Mycena citricolor]
MSFEGLISGAECAVPFNPLSQVLKHTEGDRSLQQDRIAGPSSSRLHQLPGTTTAGASQNDLAMARQFFESAPLGGTAFGAPNPMELAAHLQQQNPQHMTPANERWVMEQQQQMRAFESSGWASEFGTGVQTTPGGSLVQQHNLSRPDFQPQQTSYMSSFSQYRSPMGMDMGMYNGSGMMHSMPVQLDNKGKSREADFEAAFAQVLAAHAEEKQQSSRIEEIPEGETGLEEAMDKARLETGEETTDFKRVWDQLQNSDLPPPAEDMAKWEAQFNQLMTSERDDLDADYGAAMKNAWESGLGDFSEDHTEYSPTKFDQSGIPLLPAYVFEEENKYLAADAPVKSHLSEAKALLEQNGSLTEAALLLEAAIQKGETGEGGYEAWILLGETRNMDEREEAGMRALSQGVKLAQEAGTPGLGMLSLAISYTNESMDRASHTMLLRWILARFPSHPVPPETLTAISSNASWDTHARLTEVFLSLARDQHSRGEMDPDVQIALGILFYTNSEYDRAKDCFESALSARPKDFVLWNRFGSCLSNGNHPEEALGAYREALELRPTYTRAIYNVGVACLNIGAHKEAAEHFMSALNMQHMNGGGDTSEQLWFTLRRAFLAMDRTDLANLTQPGPARGDMQVFRAEGFDF